MSAQDENRIADLEQELERVKVKRDQYRAQREHLHKDREKGCKLLNAELLAHEKTKAELDSYRRGASAEAHQADRERAKVAKLREALKLVADSTAVLNHLPPESLEFICAALAETDAEVKPCDHEWIGSYEIYCAKCSEVKP